MKNPLAQFFSFFILIFAFQSVSAAIALGTGQSSITAGRQVPLLYGGVGAGQTFFSLHMVGVKTDRYYHNGYLLNGFANYPISQLFGGQIAGGVGLGAYFYKLGFKYTATSETIEKHEVAVGGSFRVAWQFANPVFIGLEAFFGVRNLNLAYLSAQDVTSLILGVSF